MLPRHLRGIARAQLLCLEKSSLNFTEVPAA